MKVRQDESLSNGFHRLLAAKLTGFISMDAAVRLVRNVLHETSTNHKGFCTQWRVEEKELEETVESTATTAYGAHMVDTGFQGDTIKLNMALAACPLVWRGRAVVSG